MSCKLTPRLVRPSANTVATRNLQHLCAPTQCRIARSTESRRLCLGGSRCFPKPDVVLNYRRLPKRCNSKGPQALCRGPTVMAGGVGDEVERKNLAIFVSGGGSNMVAIHNAIVNGHIPAEIKVVVSNAPGCGGWNFAKEQGIETLQYPPKKNEPGLTAAELVQSLEALEVDFVLLAGYLKLLPGEVVRAFPRRVLNIHPALLPAFGGKGMYGAHVHRAVRSSGARWTGPTVHLVDEEYDKGKIVAQRVVPVYPSDSAEQIAARVLKQEHEVYPEVVGALCSGRVEWRDDGVPVLQIQR